MITSTSIRLGPAIGRKRVVLEDIAVFINGTLFCIIRAGFETDGCSFPWWCRLTWDDPWHERYLLAAILHDWLLEHRLDMPKWEIDWLFTGALRSQNVPALEAWIFGNAVRGKRSR